MRCTEKPAQQSSQTLNLDPVLETLHKIQENYLHILFVDYNSGYIEQITLLDVTRG